MQGNQMVFESTKLPPENWVESIREKLRDKEATEKQKICVVKVPKVLKVIKPEAYTPQLIGLGPYHHWREEVYEMEQYKLIATRRAQKGCQDDDEAIMNKLNQLVNRVGKDYIAEIRACYDTHLSADDHDLAWMMVIDSIFLLQFLQACVYKGQSCLSESKRTSYLVNHRQSAYHSILKDIMKVENQIPMFFLNEILSASDIADGDVLPDMCLAMCKKLSPFPCHQGRLTQPITDNYAHLLELLYHMILPEAHALCAEDEGNASRPKHAYDQASFTKQREEEEEKKKNHPNKCVPNVKLVSETSSKMAGMLNMKLVNATKPLQALTKIPGVLNQALSIKKEGGLFIDLESGNNSSSSSSEGTPKAPTIEEIEIPCVSDLLNVGIQLVPSSQGTISSIEFNKKTGKLSLPVVRIDGNTEVILSNLVAYEAEAIPGPQILSRYTEFMNGIIDTPKDVKLLRQRKIIHSYMKTDQDVAELWNRMSRSSRLSHVPPVSGVIKELNNYYNNNKWIKFISFTKGSMLWAWRILVLLLFLAFIVLMSIQSFCSVYSSCPRLFQSDGS